jgi:hypothetical protein
MKRAESPSGAVDRWALLTAFCVLVGVVALLALLGNAHILDTAVQQDANAGGADELGSVVSTVNDIRGPATVALGSVVPLGMLVGGGMLALGNRKGIQVLASSGGAGAFVLLGNGIAA